MAFDDREGIDWSEIPTLDALNERYRRDNFPSVDEWLTIGSYPRYKLPLGSEETSVVITEGSLVAWLSVSPSQIDNYNKCERLWWFKSVARLSEPQRNFQATGEAVHLILEMADRNEGGAPRPGYEYNHSDVASLDPKQWDIAEQLARVMLPKLPKPVKGKIIQREQKIALDTYPGGPTMIGYIDLAIPPGVGWESQLIPRDDKTVIVGDYKTLSDFRYMKTPEELAQNVQMTVYGKWAMTPGGLVSWDDPSPEQAYLVHLYGRTRPPITGASVRSSSALLNRSQVDLQWEKTLDIVRRMQHDAQASESSEVAPTGSLVGHCDNMYGQPCAFRAQCGLVTESPIKQIFQIGKGKSPDMSNPSGSPLLAKIQAARAAAAGNAAPATPTPAAPVAPVTATPSGAAGGPVSSLLEQIKTKHGGRPVLSGVIALQYAREQGFDKPGTSYGGMGDLNSVTCKTIDDLVKLLSSAPKSVEPASGIIPPDAPPREQAVITKPGDQVVLDTIPSEIEDDLVDDSTPSAAITQAIAQSPTTGAAAPGNAQETAEQAATRKRGRPSNAEIAARQAAEASQREAEIERRVQERLSGLGHVVQTQVAPEWEKVTQELEQLKSDKDKVFNELLEEKKRVEIWKTKASEAKQLEANAHEMAQPAPEGFCLYIDTYPTKGAPEGLVDYLEWYAPIASGVAEANAVGDWRVIQYTAKGLLAQAMRLVISAEGCPKAMFISSQGPGADVAIEVLTPFAKRIIKGMRG